MTDWQRRLIGSIGICLLLYAGMVMLSNALETNQQLIATMPISTATVLPTMTRPTYTIQQGETLQGIANSFGVPIETLQTLNNISDPDRIYSGQTLILPPTDISAIPTTPPLAIEATEALDQGILPTLLPEAVIMSKQSDEAPSYVVNGVPSEQIILLNDAIIARIGEIYRLGQNLGRNPRAFSKLGDSTIENPFFLARFDGDDYQLGAYNELQAVIAYYRGSFSRQSIAVRRGLHTWSVLDPMWATTPCEGGENMLACEFRIHNPSILFIRLGSNDAGVPRSTEKHLRSILDFTIENGIIPIIGTKADRAEGDSNINNEIIRKLAQEYLIPLWDYDWVAGTLPARGLEADNVHMTTFYPHDYTSPIAFQRGHSVHNLTALIALDRVWRAIQQTVDSS